MWWFCGPLKAASVNAIKPHPSLSQVSPKSQPSLFQISQQFYDAAEQQQQQQRQLQIRYEFDYLSQSPIAYRIDLRLLWLLWSRAERGQLSLELHSPPPLLPLGRPLCAFNSFQFAAVQFNSNLTPFKSTTRPNIKCGSLSPALPRSLSLLLWQQVRHLGNVVCGRQAGSVCPSRVATKIPVRPKYDEANVLENQKAARKANIRI